MGNSGSKSKNKKGKQAKEGQEKPKGSQQKPSNNPQIKEQKPVQIVGQKQLTKRQRKYNPPKRGPLTFKTINQNSQNAIDKSDPLIKILEADRWVIDSQAIQKFNAKNILQMVQQSPARALRLTLTSQASFFVDSELLKSQPTKMQNQKQEEVGKKRPQKQKTTLYANLFSIKFQFLRKIKLLGPDKKAEGAIVSLEPIALIQAPLLEQLTADDHPINNIRFLRRCIWPFLSKLSLKNNSIADSNEVAKVLPTLTNIQHIEGVDLAGQFSKNWCQFGWICKIGFLDAKKEFELLEKDEKYYYRYYNKVLRRVDCDLKESKFGKQHLIPIHNKFNNPYFDNPISLW